MQLQMFNESYIIYLILAKNLFYLGQLKENS